jgi:hypothetical protein
MQRKINHRILLSLIASCLLVSAMASAQDMGTVLPLSEILHRADSVTIYQDSLTAHAKYKVKEEVVFSELNDQGIIKNSDTVISLVTMDGKKELSRQVIYTTRKNKSEGKKDQTQSKEFNFSFNDPNYNFSLTETNDSLYIIAVSPKESPKKGDFQGKFEIDRKGFFTRAIDVEVPKPEGPLKEFSTLMSFEPLEGGFVVIKDVKMKGLVKAFLGIFKMRFSGEMRYSDYELLK